MDELNRRRSFDAANAGDEAAAKRRRDKEADRTAQKAWLDDKLDEALEELFPGSDPISIVQPPQSPYDKSEY